MLTGTLHVFFSFFFFTNILGVFVLLISCLVFITVQRQADVFQTVFF